MPSARDDAVAFNLLFRRLYATFHRRDGTRADLTNASRATLTHLAQAGPVTIGEAAQHLRRAQSVVSEIVDGLAGRGLVERERDPADGRRTLVWLTAAGRDRIVRDADVLDIDLLQAALAGMGGAERAALLAGLATLAGADAHSATKEPT